MYSALWCATGEGENNVYLYIQAAQHAVCVGYKYKTIRDINDKMILRPRDSYDNW
jgi:hypothetical protein